MTGKETIQITVQNRKPGKGLSRRARNEKLVPAVVYGPNVDNQLILIDELTIERYGRPKYESTIFDLKSDEKGLGGLKVLMKQVQKDPVTHRPVHVDLYALDMKASIRVNIELKLEGEPEGVKTEGGQLMQNLREVEVECQPSDIPDAIVVNVSHLNLNESVHISDVQLPPGVVAITPGERTIATVTSARAEEESTPAVAAEGAEAGAAAGAKGSGDSSES